MSSNLATFSALFLALLSACAHQGQGIAQATNAEAVGTTTPQLRPSLVALSVSDLDASLQWYGEVLGFTESERYEFPEDGMRLAFMEKDGFELELIELAGAAPFEAPDPGNPATRRGLVKVAFHSSAIDELYTSALEAGAKVQSSLRESSRTGGRFFILLDPDGNWVQIFG